MNRTRWKMMIGALGLSLGGLAAVAGVPASDGMVSCAGAPTHTVARVSEPPAPPTPKPVVAPTPGGIPVPELPSVPPLPAVPPPAAPIPLPVPTPPLPRIDPVTPQVPTIPAPKPLELLPVSLPAPEPLKPVGLPPVPRASEPKPPPIPAPSPSFAGFAYAETPTPINATPVPAPVPSPPVEAAKVAERKLKVILSMGDERPRFEVRDGDEVYLKVVCDRVEVKSPGEGGASVSTMSATGKVTFVTPGGEGTCDQLSVLPGTGQVVVTGKVTFTYNWGKVETTVTGEKMNFRLGSNTVTPTAQGTNSGVTGVPASFTRPQ